MVPPYAPHTACRAPSARGGHQILGKITVFIFVIIKVTHVVGKNILLESKSIITFIPNQANNPALVSLKARI